MPTILYSLCITGSGDNHFNSHVLSHHYCVFVDMEMLTFTFENACITTLMDINRICVSKPYVRTLVLSKSLG